MQIPRVYADFNALEAHDEGASHAEMDLTGYGTLRSLAQQRLRLEEGMALVLYEPNDIECAAVAHFDANRRDPTGRTGVWIARLNPKAIRSGTRGELLSPEHPCLACGTDFGPLLEEVGQNYTERCSVCGESVMAPLAPPKNAT